MSQKHVKKLINLTLKSQVKVVSGLTMFVTHSLMVIHPFAKYGKAMSRQKKVMSRTWRHVKNLINLTLRSKVNVVSDHEWTPHIVSRWYTHMPNMVSQCQSKKTIMGLTWICTDRLTVKWTKWFLYTPLNWVFEYGFYHRFKKIWALKAL